MTSVPPLSPIVLVAGHWLGATAWQTVQENLTASGYAAVAVTLPGLDPTDPHRLDRTLDDQVTALRAAVLHAEAPVVIVAHSGANAPVSMLLDQHPEHIHHVVWVDSGPAAPDTAFAADLPETVTELPLPAFEELGTQASLDGLTSDQLQQFRDLAVSQPTRPLRATVTLANPARYDLPTTLICCSLPSTTIQELIASGHRLFEETGKLTHSQYINLTTGHWPMWSAPDELAQVIGERALQPPRADTTAF